MLANPDIILTSVSSCTINLREMSSLSSKKKCFSLPPSVSSGSVSPAILALRHHSTSKISHYSLALLVAFRALLNRNTVYSTIAADPIQETVEVAKTAVKAAATAVADSVQQRHQEVPAEAAAVAGAAAAAATTIVHGAAPYVQTHVKTVRTPRRVGQAPQDYGYKREVYEYYYY
jgi:aspartate aminotransferase-like enzyme